MIIIVIWNTGPAGCSYYFYLESGFIVTINI